MKANPFDQCLAALDAGPLSDEEVAEFESRKADVRAADERRQSQTGQLELKTVCQDDDATWELHQ